MSNEKIQEIYENNLKIQATLDMLVQTGDYENVDKVAFVMIALDYANSNNSILQKAV